MARPAGGTNVRTGFYWNLRKWELTTVPRPGGVLPGGTGETYVKVPTLALLLVAPVMGGLYVMFLPFIGIAMVVGHLAHRGRAAARAGFMEVASMLNPNWAPAVAYLAAKKAKKATRAVRSHGAGGMEPPDETRGR
ncbi:MAG: hypothetical protein ACE148_16875 [Vicinamibacterales bacterium]